MTNQHVPTGPHELELEMLDLRPALEAVLMVADQPLDHLTLAQAVGHPPVDVEQAHLVVDQLRRKGGMTFRALTVDAPDLATKVARFLAVLELFREGAISFEQATPLGDLHIRWTGTDDGDIDVGAEFDAPSIASDDEPVLIDASLIDESLLDDAPSSHDAPTSDEPESTDD
jgi:segregation and condensation protein A